MRYYSGIGSRKTPASVLAKMTKLATKLEADDFILRSGAADGADTAFEIGVTDPSMKEIWVPWLKFNGSESTLTPTARAFEIAERFHPFWENCSHGAKKLHARNVHQILGADLNTPSEFVLCWTADGKDSGGTGTAIRIAEYYGIRVKNLFNK